MAGEGEYGREASGDREDVFPHDRVVFFSDAVFAIAITLLAIELRLPGKELIEQVGESAAYQETVPLFVSYFISFAVTGLFWSTHMQTWKHVRRVNARLVWCTLLQLMFVALMPFATREYSEAFSAHAPGRSAFYAFVLTMIALFSLLTRHVVIRQEHLVESQGRASVRWMYGRGLVSLVLFAAAIPLAFVLPTWTTGLIFFLIFPVSRIVRHACFRHVEAVEAKEPVA